MQTSTNFYLFNLAVVDIIIVLMGKSQRVLLMDQTPLHLFLAPAGLEFYLQKVLEVYSHFDVRMLDIANDLTVFL